MSEDPEQLIIPGTLSTIGPKKSAQQEALEVQQTAAEKILAKKKAEEDAELASLELGDSLEWTHLTPRAQIAYLKHKRYQVYDNGPLWISMKAIDAMGMVGYALENGLSVLGNDLYPIFKKIGNEWRVINFGKSSEARAKVAKREGVTFGPPHYERVKQDWPEKCPIEKPWWTETDIGVECQMNVYVSNAVEISTYTAWLSEWYQGKSSDRDRRAFWDKNPWWMLQVRSKEKLITLASGVGQSDAVQDDAPAQTQEILPPEKPEIKTTEYKEKRK